MLVLLGTLPFWDRFRTPRRRAGRDARRQRRRRRAAGRGALQSGLDISVKTRADFGVALVGFVLLTVWRAPPLVVVIVSAAAGVAAALWAG